MYIPISFCRVVHFQPEKGGYYCVPCKRNFSLWRCFTRHEELKHGQHEVFCCDSCTYKTSRKDNMIRHTRRTHGAQQIVSSLINDLLSELVAQYDVEEVVDVVKEGTELSPYERMRNERVAEIRKRFESLFSEEIEASKEKKRNKVKSKRKAAPCRAGTRRSSRWSGGDNASKRVESDAVETSEDATEEAAAIRVGEEVDGGGDMVPSQPEAEPFLGHADDNMAEVQEAKFSCIPCGMKFRDVANMHRHVKLIHKPRLNPVCCPRTWCTSLFSTMADMYQHRKSCLLTCPDCGKSFQKEPRFAAHRRFHKTMARRMADW